MFCRNEAGAGCASIIEQEKVVCMLPSKSLKETQQSDKHKKRMAYPDLALNCSIPTIERANRPGLTSRKTREGSDMVALAEAEVSRQTIWLRYNSLPTFEVNHTAEMMCCSCAPWASDAYGSGTQTT